MDRRELARYVKEMDLPLTALEQLELIEGIISHTFEKSAGKRAGYSMLMRDNIGQYDAGVEMSRIGTQISRGMQMLFTSDIGENDRDLSRYYASI